ncbi:RluA family pseudouridine synthase [Halothiobacillus sp.]|uniref:RluA family pseudouridine synthase n=1 Tax=Halothiobacillus sp. TaxID=1891311 RepID=UPI002AD4AE65|nr:RluA family pseudouridine synthase [Halothiobacillus sp.]
MNQHQNPPPPRKNAARRVTVEAQYTGQRIDNFLHRTLGATHGELPRSLIYRILRTGEVRINSQRAKPTTRVSTGDEIRIPPLHHRPDRDPNDPDAPVTVPNYWLERAATLIVFEDDDLLIVNKPGGLAVHGGSNIPFGLIDLMRQHLDNPPLLELAHRIDRDTSGLVVLAKSLATLGHIQNQFRPEGNAEKTYLTLVHGHWPDHLTRIDVSLRKWQGEGEAHRVVVDPQGKPAVTHFSTLAANAHASLLKVGLETGRTHQIRVHAAHAGYPVIGDSKYGQRILDKRLSPKAGERHTLLLHAAALTLHHPVNGALLKLVAPVPDTWGAWTDALNLAVPTEFTAKSPS